MVERGLTTRSRGDAAHVGVYTEGLQRAPLTPTLGLNMHISRAILISLLTLIMTWPLLQEIHSGLTIGRIEFSAMRYPCLRSDNPFGFWALMALFSASIIGAGYFWWLHVGSKLSEVSF
jgi:hypothetical protein